MYTLIGGAKIYDIDPRAWLAAILARMPTSRKASIMNCCLEIAITSNQLKTARTGSLADAYFTTDQPLA